MVRVISGDMFGSEAQTLVNTVNCVGIMGKGIALEFKKRFPDMYEDYVGRCDARQVRLGQPYLYRRMFFPWILNFPTKDHWRSVSRLEDIEAGLRFLETHYQEWGITSLAVPPLGCGHGQLEWQLVGPTLYRYLNRLDIVVELYAPQGTPPEQLRITFLDKPSQRPTAALSPHGVGPAWVALVEILKRIEDEPFHWPVGRTTFQKIAYFATECGIPTGLKYERGSYGPYSPALRERVTSLVNNGLLEEEKLGRMFAVRVGRTAKDAGHVYGRQLEEWKASIERVADLFMRMDTKQAEIAATVHFAAKTVMQMRGGTATEADVLSEVMEWKQKRKPPLDRREVALTIRNLNLLGWIEARPSLDMPVTDEDMIDV